MGGPLGGLLGGGHSPGACSHRLEAPPNPDMSGLLLQPGKVGNLDPPLYFSFYSHLNSNSSFISSYKRRLSPFYAYVIMAIYISFLWLYKCFYINKNKFI